MTRIPVCASCLGSGRAGRDLNYGKCPDCRATGYPEPCESNKVAALIRVAKGSGL